MSRLRVETLYQYGTDGWSGFRILQKRGLLGWKTIDAETIPSEILSETGRLEEGRDWVSKFARYGEPGPNGVIAPFRKLNPEPAHQEEDDPLIYCFAHILFGMLYGFVVCALLAWLTKALTRDANNIKFEFQIFSGLLISAYLLMRVGAAGDSLARCLFRQTVLAITLAWTLIAVATAIAPG